MQYKVQTTGKEQAVYLHKVDVYVIMGFEFFFSTPEEHALSLHISTTIVILTDC